MRLSLAAGLLACSASSAHAVAASSPFVLFSTSEFPIPAQTAQLQTSAQVLASARAILSSCPTDRYVVVSQPNAGADDIRTATGGCAAPNLCRAVSGDQVATAWSVAEVLGSLSGDGLADYIRASCLERGRAASVNDYSLQALPREKGERAKVLAKNDHELGQILERAEVGADYTVIYLSDPNDPRTYEADFQEPLRMELKRGEPVLVGRRQADGSPVPRSAGLFEKYQFFTPGIFMGFVAALVLLSILYVGISAIGSLEVSYGAFDKENGPAAQKK